MDRRASHGAWLFSCAVLLITLTASASAFAQAQGNATILGTILDKDGVVPGATITATDSATGLVRTGVTGSQGEFRITSLPPGKYSVKIEMASFKRIDQEFTLLSGETRDLGKLTLTVGGREESITVTADVTPVQTSSSSLQKNLSGDLLTSVQVKGRDIFGMLKILPGVVDAQASRDFAQWNSGRYLSINGGLSLNKNTTIDGVPSGEEGGNGTTHITPNIDSVAEVNVITSGYTAENGRQASGQVIMTTKSGTNQLKGSGWYNGRRDWMNKNDFFRLKQGAVKPPFAVNIGGFSIGGPVVIPGVMDSRKSGKKLFFFGSNESTQDVRPTAIQFTNLPTARERAGDFTRTFFGNANGTADGQFLSGTQTLLTIKNPSGAADFYCAAGTGGLNGGCQGTSTATNIINPKYFNSVGAAMLNLLPLPNNKYNPAANQFNTANDMRDTLPLHTRKNYVLRMDAVLSNKVRFSVRSLIDRDDSTTYNAIAPGLGSSDNTYNGDMYAGSVTWVVKPTVVNELTTGYTADWWGFRAKPGKIEASDYTPWFRGAQNPFVNATLPDPPRLAPYPSQFLSTDPLPLLGSNQATQLPYFPDMQFSGGSVSGYTTFRPGGPSAPMPRQNYNPRFTFADDLSIVHGRHSLKFGFSMERNAKTEPGNSDVNGVYNFGDSTSNPLSTGSGYANALLGIYQSYTERNFRVDRNDTHWLGEAYAQDTWRVTPRLTLDYGVRFTHTGSMFETRSYNSGFNPALYTKSQAGVLFLPYCATGVAGNVTCATANRLSYNPLLGAPGGTNSFSQAFAGTLVPGVGNVSDGMFTGGLDGKKPGEYDSLKYLSYGPRFGFAWDVFGNGKTAIRGASGVFYNFFSCCNYPYNGGPLISISRQILNAQIGDIPQFVQSGNLAVSPQNAGIPLDFNPPLYGQDIKPGQFQTSMHYQANFAVQRDIGFSTVVEVAYVGNFGRHYYQGKTTNNPPVNAFANPANLFNNEAIAANFVRRDFPGIGALTYPTSDFYGLNYNSLQISVQRRLSHGLQLGGAYTLAKGMGMGAGRGWDFMTEELYGDAGLRKLYYGPIAVNAGNDASDQGQERRHVAVFHYSYQIPTINKPVLKWVLGGWEASGVTTIVTGDAVNPVCNMGGGISGIANNDPSLSGVSPRCEYVPGQAVLSGYDPTQGQSGVLIEDQLHFNVAAFQRPLPTNTSFTTTGILGPGAQGNIGNVGWGILRNPGWSNWDFTLGRRIPLKLGSQRKANMRIQLQFYNLFNQVEFNKVGGTYAFTAANATGGFGGGNTNTQTGRYTSTQNPFNAGITIRFDY
jgi:hypothetical protein